MALGIIAEKRQPHVAIFNCAEHGHVNPTLGMVKELVARGYRVSYTTSAEFAPLVTACGALPVLFEPTFSKEKPRPEDMGHVVIELAKEARATYRGLAEKFEHDRPDIIAYGPLSWLGKIFSYLWNIPSVALNPTHAGYQGQSQEWLGLNHTSWPCIPILEAMLKENSQQFPLESILSKHENTIAFIPRSFQEKPETVDQNVLFVGPEITGRTLCSRWRRKQTERPIIVVSLGSVYTNQPDFFKTCIAAFSGTEWHVILTIGRYVKPEQLGIIPDNIEIHSHIPQLEALQSAALFITHAGMNSVMEAVHFGVPMIAIPQQAEQRVNARRIQDLGLGKYLPRETIDANSLRQAVQEIMADPAYLKQLAHFQQELKQAGGAKAAVDLFDRIRILSR